MTCESRTKQEANRTLIHVPLVPDTYQSLFKKLKLIATLLANYTNFKNHQDLASIDKGAHTHIYVDVFMVASHQLN